MNFFLLCLFGFLLSFGLSWVAITLFPRWNLMDFPHKYGLSRPPLPYPLGTVFVLGTLFVPVIVPQFFWVAGLLLLLAAVSFWDDRCDLPIFPRIFVHISIGIAVYLLGIQIYVIGHPFLPTNIDISTMYPIIAFMITVVWIFFIQNAMNWFDGLRGLSCGVSSIAFLVLGCLGIIRPELFFNSEHLSLTYACFFLAGICFGMFPFLFKNKAILGDTGSQTMGFLLAVVAIFSGAKIATTLLVLSIPLMDLVFVILRRIIVDKKMPWKRDTKHLHHNFTHIFSEKNTIILFLSVSVLLGIFAVFLQGFYKFIAIAVTIILFFTISAWALYRRNQYVDKKINTIKK